MPQCWVLLSPNCKFAERCSNLELLEPLHQQFMYCYLVRSY